MAFSYNSSTNMWGDCLKGQVPLVFLAFNMSQNISFLYLHTVLNY